MDKVANTRDRLRELGARVQVNRRTLTSGRKKVYLRVRGRGGHREFYQIAMRAVRENWPDAYMTSGGFSIHKQEPEFDCTVALEK